MEAEPFLPSSSLAGPETEVLKLSSISTLHSRFLSQRPLVGATLHNLGNTCFMNAVLQCITHMVPLVEKLRSNHHNPTCSDKDDQFCSFCALRNHVHTCITMSGLIVSPRSFAYNINKISPYFEPGEQQDAHEFLNYLLDSVDRSFLKPNLNDQHPSSLEGDSPVNQLFRGHLKSQLQCSACGHCSDTYEHILDLSLEIDDVESLTDALESFTSKEEIEDIDTKFTCDGCKDQVSMDKQLKIDQPPTILSLHLKRFKQCGLFTHKIGKFVNYPLELDLRPYMSCPSEDEQPIYDLYAIVVHDGSCYSGHYYCNIRTSLITWHQMNDSLKCMISESTALDQEAYILFYIKKGSYPWFTSLMDKSESPSSVLEHEDIDPASSSGGEDSFSSSREALKKEECPSPSTSLVVDELRDDNPSSPCTFREFSSDRLGESNPSNASTSPDTRNIGVASVSTSIGRYPTQPAKRPGSDHHIIDVFTDEPLEEDKEIQIISQNHLGSKGGSVEAGKHIVNTVQNARLSQFRGMLDHMPESRGSSILACLDNFTEPECNNDRPSKRRHRVFVDGKYPQFEL